VSDRIALSGIEVFAHHGVLDSEQEEGQLFAVDVDLSLDLTAPGHSDRLTDTVDYGALAGRIHDLVASERWNLIEKVAQRVADLVLENSLVEAVTVTVHKPQAPIEVPFRDVTVTITRSR
jgi:7,8-dihydroneopterin aldolase/epimerase/oxygenase